MAPFEYFDSSHGSINNAGFKYANIRYRPTSFYDVDPSVGGTTIVGYTLWSSVYQYYRVRSFNFKFTATNADAFGYQMQCLPLQLDPGANNSTAYSTWKMNEYCKSAQLSDKGGSPDTKTIVNRVNCRQFVGDKTQAVDDNYASAFGTSPSNNIYMPAGIYSPANNFVNGCQSIITCLLRVEMWERTDLLDDPRLLLKLMSGELVPTENYSRYICANCSASQKARVIIPELGSTINFTLVCVKCYHTNANMIIERYKKRLTLVSEFSIGLNPSKMHEQFRRRLHRAISHFKAGRADPPYEDSDESSCSEII